VSCADGIGSLPVVPRAGGHRLLRASGLGVREIARRVKRDQSTISRELRRNASTRTWRLDCKPSIAQWHAERRCRRPKVAKLASNDRLRDYMQDRLLASSGRHPPRPSDTRRPRKILGWGHPSPRSTSAHNNREHSTVDFQHPANGVGRAT
jgi:Helix-turn-helix domain